MGPTLRQDAAVKKARALAYQVPLSDIPVDATALYAVGTRGLLHNHISVNQRAQGNEGQAFVSAFTRYEPGGTVTSYLTFAGSKHDLNYDNATCSTSYLGGYSGPTEENINDMAEEPSSNKVGGQLYKKKKLNCAL